jgi:hypothetical protein
MLLARISGRRWRAGAASAAVSFLVLLAGAQAAGGQATTSTQRLTLEATFTMPNACTGEPMLIDFRQVQLVHITDTQNGQIEFVMVSQHAQGTGLVTGTHYVLNLRTAGASHTLTLSRGSTTVTQQTIVSGGPGPDFKLRILAKIEVTPSGTASVSFVREDSSCS